METTKPLYLTLKKKWFDMIASGDKPEEYREVNMFWAKRLCNRIPTPHGGFLSPINSVLLGEDLSGWKKFTGGCSPFKEWDSVLFANGGHFGDVPKQTKKFLGIEIREGRPEWGAEPGKKYFVIKLG